MLEYMCDTLKKVIWISPRLSTIIRKYRKNENDLVDKVRGSIQSTIIKYKFILISGINEPSNEFY